MNPCPIRKGIAMEKFYNIIIENLEQEIAYKYGSIKKFSEQKGFSRFTLSKVFKGHQDISLHLYLKICIALNVLPLGSNLHSNYGGTLKEYITVDHDRVITSILKIIATGEIK